MISIPVAVHIDFFEWQLELFWFCHRRIYGDDAQRRAHAIVIRRNQPRERAVDHLSWPTDIPHTMCESFFDLSLMSYVRIAAPLNIQAGLLQVLTRFDDEELIEVIDCDMFHLRPVSVVEVADNELCVCTVYEDWHLHSLTHNRTVIEPYFENGGAFYNGGFVPIIGKVRTFRKILREWIAVHVDILQQPFGESIHWWAGMFALQAACEKARVEMVNLDCCYIPGINALSHDHHIAHYSVDQDLNKNVFPAIDVERFDSHEVYGDLVRSWLEMRAVG